MPKNALNLSTKYLAEFGKTGILAQKRPKIDPKKPWKWSKHPLKCFGWFNTIFRHVFERILGPKMAKNALNLTKKCLPEIGKTGVCGPKMTENRPKNTLNVAKTPPKMFRKGQKHFFERF